METVRKIKDLEIQFNGSSTYYILYVSTNGCSDTVVDRVDTLRKANNRFNKIAKLAGYTK